MFIADGQEKPALCTEEMADTALKEASERIVEATRSSQPPRTPSRSSRSSSMVTPTKISTRNALRTTPNSSKQSSPNKPQYTEKVREALMTISESTSEESVVQQEEISKLSPEKYREEQKDIASNIIQNTLCAQLFEKPQEEETKYLNILKADRCETNISQVPAAEPSKQSSTIESIDQSSRTGQEHEAMESSVDKVSEVEQSIAETSVDETKDIMKLEEKGEIKKDIDINKMQDDTFKKNVQDKTSVEEHIKDVYNVKHNVDIPEVEQPTHVIPEQVDRTYNTELEEEEEIINNDCMTQEEKMDISVDRGNVDEKIDNIDTSQNEQVLIRIICKIIIIYSDVSCL